MKLRLVDSANPSGMGDLHWQGPAVPADRVPAHGADVSVGPSVRAEVARGALTLTWALRAQVWTPGDHPHEYGTRPLSALEKSAIKEAWPSFVRGRWRRYWPRPQPSNVGGATGPVEVVIRPAAPGQDLVASAREQITNGAAVVGVNSTAGRTVAFRGAPEAIEALVSLMTGDDWHEHVPPLRWETCDVLVAEDRRRPGLFRPGWVRSQHQLARALGLTVGQPRGVLA